MISSRTPEAAPNRCPTCGTDVWIDPSRPFGDAPCPLCGVLLWFVHRADDSALVAALPPEERDGVIELLAERLGTEPDADGIADALRTRSDTDSLELVELVMELEDEFDGGKDP